MLSKATTIVLLTVVLACAGCVHRRHHHHNHHHCCEVNDMRKMTNGTTTLNVVDHLVLKNGWEYYITDEHADSGTAIRFCLVCGYAIEMGDVYMPELTPYIVSRAKGDLADLMPAPGWQWVDKPTTDRGLPICPKCNRRIEYTIGGGGCPYCEKEET